MKLKDMMRLFPDFFDKREGSNLTKVMSLFSSEINTLRDEIEKVDDWKQIDQAQGKVLDKIGEEYGEQRGSLDDDFYRYMIKSKIIQRRMDGSTNQLIDIIHQTLNVPTSQIKVTESRSDPSSMKGIQTISVDGIPAKYLIDNKLLDIFLERIYGAVAAGIALEKVSFDMSMRQKIVIGTCITITESVVIR